MARYQLNRGRKATLLPSHKPSAATRNMPVTPSVLAMTLATLLSVPAAWAIDNSASTSPAFGGAATDTATAGGIRAPEQTLFLSFDDAVERTLNQNAAMDLSQAHIAEARAAIEQASGNLLPTLDLSFGVMGTDNPLNVFGMKLQQEQATFNDFGVSQYFETSNFLTNPTPESVDRANNLAPDALNNPGWHHNVQTSLKLSIPVYNGGKIRQMRTQAQALLQAAQAGDDAARQQLVLHTIEAYAGINTAEAFVEVAEQAYQAAESYRDLSQKLYDEGVVTKSDLLKARVNLGERELDRENARHQAENAADGLKVLTGIDTDRPIGLSHTIDVSLPETDLTGARQQALANNPRIRALRGQIDAARAEVDVARADYKPHINLMAQQDFNDESVGLKNDSYTVGGQLTWRIFDFGARSGKVDRAQARVNASLAERQQALDQLIGQVGKVWREANMAEKRVEVRRLAIEQSAEAARLETLRYQQGLATMTELLAAQTELDNARAELIRAYFQRTMQRAALWLALGELTPEHVGAERGNNLLALLTNSNS
ncbi:MAG TPA: TolC family protein [Guyparkeria sp.]|nr:TolC family protein [Guyparkeria sp.]